MCKSITCSGQTLNQWVYASADGRSDIPRSAPRGDALNPAFMTGHGLPPNVSMGMRDLQYQVYNAQQQGIDPSLALAAEQRLAYYAQLGAFPSGHSGMVGGPPMHSVAMENPAGFTQGMTALDTRFMNNYQINRPVNTMPIYDDGNRAGNFLIPPGQIPFGNQMVGYPYNPTAMQMAPNILSYDAFRQQQQGQIMQPSLTGATPLNSQQAAVLNRQQMDAQLTNNYNNSSAMPKDKNET